MGETSSRRELAPKDRPKLPHMRPIPISENGLRVLKGRYLRKGPDGKPVESPHEMFWRVAYHVAGAEDELGGDRMMYAEKFYDLLTSFLFLPNSPTFTGAGTPLGQLAACFVLPIADDMGRERSGIFQTLRDAALIQQTGGGNGFSFSRLRPRGALVRSSNGQATGPVGFLRVYDQAFGEIAQGGCLTPDTLVFTGRGLLRLDEVVRAEGGGWHDHDVIVMTDDGPRRSRRGFNNGVKPVLEVNTREGLKLRGTPDHKVKVRCGGMMCWRRLDELQAGDEILVGLGHHHGEIQALRRTRLSHDYPNLISDYPPILDEEFAFFLGYWAARGLDGPGIGVSVPLDLYLRAEVPDLMRRLFGRRPHKDYAEGGTLLYRIDDPTLEAFFEVNGLYCRDEVPKAVRMSPPEMVGAYLRGMFEAVGRVRGNIPTLVLRSETLARQVAAILIGLGSPVEVASTANSWETRLVTTQGIVVWRERIGCDSRSRFYSRIRGRRVPFKIPAFGRMGSSRAELFDRWYVTVKSVVASGYSLTLDLEVEDNHTYIANGMVTHNSRRGANMAVLRVDHPDIESFITCKTDENQITNFNISVGITDRFMNAVEADEEFELVNPQDGKVWRKVRAREVFRKIARQAHHNGEPGVLFLDAANRTNPVPHLYELEATNPCGEQWLGPYESCCLGSVNLARHVTDDGRVDWDGLESTVKLAVRFLDDVVTANAYVPEVPELKAAAHNVRRIGLGIMGLADMMYRLGVRYGSEEGQEFAGQLMEFVRFHAMKASIELARERGPFPAIKGSIYDPDALRWKPPRPLMPYRRDWGRPELNWDEITSGIMEWGIRNGATTTIAPTGTIATVTGCEGYGCEPVFALAYIRHFNDNGKDVRLQYVSPLFMQALERAGVDEETRQHIVKQVNVSGSCQDVDEVPDEIKRVFVVAFDISPEEHVRMQAALQAFVDNSISKTINMPQDATVEDVEKVYKLAWRLGCKGLTVYVTGSREKVVLETREIAKTKGQAPKMLFNEEKKPRPRSLQGKTYRVETPVGAAYVTVNWNGDEQPFEVFLNTSKAGSETAAVSEALGRLISYILRLASPVSPMDRLREVVRQLVGIGGGRSMGFGAARVRSLPDGVAQVLQEFIDEMETARDGGSDGQARRLPSDGQKPLPLVIGDLCPECGEPTMVNEEGCRKCYTCGYSEC